MSSCLFDHFWKCLQTPVSLALWFRCGNRQVHYEWLRFDRILKRSISLIVLSLMHAGLSYRIWLITRKMSLNTFALCSLPTRSFGCRLYLSSLFVLCHSLWWFERQALISLLLRIIFQTKFRPFYWDLIRQLINRCLRQIFENKLI